MHTEHIHTYTHTCTYNKVIIHKHNYTISLTNRSSKLANPIASQFRLRNGCKYATFTFSVPRSQRTILGHPEVHISGITTSELIL